MLNAFKIEKPIDDGTGSLNISWLSTTWSSSSSDYIELDTQHDLSNKVASTDVSLDLKISAAVLYSLSVLLGVSGNCLVLLVIYFYRPVKTVNNYFIGNLAISELIFILLSVPSTYVTAYLYQHWPFSQFLCVFFNYMQTVSVTITVYILIWITMDKYWALVKPFKLRMSLKISKILMIFSWLFGLFISLPIAFFTKLIDVHNENDTQNGSNSTRGLGPQCVEVWPMNMENFSTTYNVLLLAIQYFLPLILLSYCYLKIGLVLMKAKSPGDYAHNRDVKMSQSKRKLVKMSFCLVSSFIVSWAPLQFLNTYRFFSDRISSSEYFGAIFLVCHLFAISGAYLNPFIYALTNVHFRNGFRYYLCCRKGGKHNQMSLHESEMQRLTNNYRTDSVRNRSLKRFESLR